MASRTTGGSTGKPSAAPSSDLSSPSLPFTADELQAADVLASQPGGLDAADLRTRHAALLAVGGSLGDALEAVAEALEYCIDDIGERSLVTRYLDLESRRLVVIAQHVRDLEEAYEELVDEPIPCRLTEQAAENAGETIPSPRMPAAVDAGLKYERSFVRDAGKVLYFVRVFEDDTAQVFETDAVTHCCTWSVMLAADCELAPARGDGDPPEEVLEECRAHIRAGRGVMRQKPTDDPLFEAIVAVFMGAATGNDSDFHASPADRRGLAAVLSFLRAKLAQAPAMPSAPAPEAPAFKAGGRVRVKDNYTVWAGHFGRIVEPNGKGFDVALDKGPLRTFFDHEMEHAPREEASDARA